ncbi:MAG: galactose-1-phosphate uridylyltransferase [Acidobacteriaceae bacterium]
MPELRKDPVTGRWVIISTERARRPDQLRNQPFRHPGGFCPFCPGNEAKTPPEVLAYRKGNAEKVANGSGWSLRVVPNKFPALGIEGTLDRHGDGLYDHMNGVGAHEVIVDSPEHEASFATMSEKQIEDVIWAFRDRITDLKRDKRFRYILLFKNHGDAAGATHGHPHCQLIALPIVPTSVRGELDGSKQYWGLKERCIYCDIVRQEQADDVRIVSESQDFLTVAPYAPRFPFETWIIPKQHQSSFEDSASHTYESLARALKSLIARAEIVLDRPAYNLLIHTSPINMGPREESVSDYYHWHVEFMPAMTRAAGFEWGTGFYINPIPPEEAAKYLREAVISC